MNEIEGLPEEIDSGDIAFTFSNYDSDGSGPTLFDFRATWDGGRTMTWWQDISERQPGLSPMSSAPSEGWASWRNGHDLLVAYTWPDLETDGWATFEAARLLLRKTTTRCMSRKPGSISREQFSE